MESTIKYIELPNQIKLSYIEQGNSSGLPVVLLHGLTDSCRSYERVLPHLPASIRAFALSLRGHGDSDRPAEGYRPSDFARDVAEFLDVLEVESAVIVGHSMGSYAAQQFAIDYPERTSGLVLIGSFINCLDNPGLVEFHESAVSKLRDPIDPNFVREFQESTLAQPVPQEFLEMVVHESLKVPARVWNAALAGLLEVDLSGELDKIKSPTLIIWGDRDTYFPRSDQERLAATIADSKLLMYSGAGHAPHWEEPERFTADLVGFINNRVRSPQ